MKPAVLVFLTALTGCEAPITFTTQLRAETTIAGGGPLISLLDAFPQMSSFANIDFNTNDDFENNSTEKQFVKLAKVTSFTLKILSPNDQDFGFLDSLTFSIGSDAGADTVVATKQNISELELAAPHPTLVLDVPGEDIAHHIRADTVSFITSGTGRKPVNDTTVEATVDLYIGAGL